jgi:uncharacterized protein (DUF488 family)
VSKGSGFLQTIGHSNHRQSHFQELLKAHHIEVLVDVRSWPHSRYVQWADRSNLPQVAEAAESKYLFLGDSLGGRPEGAEYYDKQGHVLYGRVARRQDFTAGIARLQRGVLKCRLAIMCSEEDPTHCHRRLLVAKVLLERGVGVKHIRGDGRVEEEPGLIRLAEGTLLEDEEGLWRSSRSVSPKRRQSASLAA